MQSHMLKAFTCFQHRERISNNMLTREESCARADHGSFRTPLAACRSYRAGASPRKSSLSCASCSHKTIASPHTSQSLMRLTDVGRRGYHDLR